MNHRTLALAAALLTTAIPGQAQVGRTQGIVDANVLEDSIMVRIPGMTPALVRAVVAGRPYHSILALDSVLAAGGLTPAQRTVVYGGTFIHVNLLTAPRAELLLIPGVGARMAHEFEEYRPYGGGLPTFRREIRKYVDSAEVARLEQYVFIPVNLNTASDAEILSIPGVGRRMLREFKEYRPYNDIERFRREIGKYVSAAEVARLERFVRVN
jgi:predicted DNA-binding helix-hairpin-helix protein